MSLVLAGPTLILAGAARKVGDTFVAFGAFTTGVARGIRGQGRCRGRSGRGFERRWRGRRSGSGGGEEIVSMESPLLPVEEVAEGLLDTASLHPVE